MYVFIDNIISGAATASDWVSAVQAVGTLVALLLAVKAAADGAGVIKKGADADDVGIVIAGTGAVLAACAAGIMGGVQGIAFAAIGLGLAKPLPGYLSRHIEKLRKRPQPVPSRRMLGSLDGIERPELYAGEDFADAREGRQTPEPEHIPRVTGGTMDRPDLEDEDEEDADREKSSEEKRRKRREIKLET